jgi:acetyl-CoA C-acetyltransferase
VIFLVSDVAIIGIGSTNYTPTSENYSYKELMYEAAVKAYTDANIEPRKDLDAIVTTSEDFWEGLSIFDEYVPDQLGGVLKPVFTVTGDGLLGIIQAYLLIKTGYFNVVAVEAHSKASDIDSIMDIWRFAFDPYIHRPLIDNPHILAGLEMMSFIEEYDVSREALSAVVSKNRFYALFNPIAAYGAKVGIEDINNSPLLSYPLRKLDVSRYSDGATVVVLGSREIARRLVEEPIWIEGIGWISESPYIEEWDLSTPFNVRLAGEMAYRMAGISNPYRDIDILEIDDRYSYRELQNIVALGLSDGYSVDELIFEDVITLNGELPTNPSGGYLGIGYPLEAGGLLKLYNVVKQLRGLAGNLQVVDCERGLAMSRREFPSSSTAVVILRR